MSGIDKKLLAQLFILPTYEPPEKSQCFTITWKIEKISLFSSFTKDILLQLFPLKTDTTQGTEWWKLHFRFAEPYIFIGLENVKGECDDFRHNLDLSSSRGKHELKRTNSKCFQAYITKSELFDDNRPQVLHQDILTLSCTIWHQTMLPGEKMFHTKLQKVNFLWKTEDYLSCRGFHTWHQDGNILLDINFLYSSCDKKLIIKFILIPTFSGLPRFLDCRLSTKGCQVRLYAHDYAFPFISQMFELDIDKSNTTNFMELELNSLVAEHFEVQQKSSDSVSDDLLCLFKEGFHSDVILNTKEKSFKAHKIILAARSRVFRSRFADDSLAESQSGVIDILDIDSVTFYKMLAFMYGDLLADIQWQDAVNLYDAAVKYAVHPLKRKCVDIIKSGLAASNACEVLVLADKHSDQNLLKLVVDFIDEHNEVIESEDWDTLEGGNPRLTSKIARQLYLRKGRKGK